MPDELFKKQREGYIVKKLEISKRMRMQGNKFWEEITNHQFCFDRGKNKIKCQDLYLKLFAFYEAQLEAEVIRKLERKDLLSFYDHYISPHSMHRRKLALHVNPSSLALQTQSAETSNSESENELEGSIGEELSSTNNEKQTENIATTEINYEATNLCEQIPITDADKFTGTSSEEAEKILLPNKVTLSEV